MKGYSDLYSNIAVHDGVPAYTPQLCVVSYTAISTYSSMLFHTHIINRTCIIIR